MVPDPYKALHLPHTASAAEIKKRYRELARKFHPDRMMHAPPDEKEQANVSFAQIAGAYAILTDPQRKAQYDHIYRYGGYDDDDDKNADEDDDGIAERVQGDENNGIPSRTREYGGFSPRGGGGGGGGGGAGSSPFGADNNGPSSTRKRKSVGVGYACTDPLAFIWTQGRIQTTTNVAGIQIPSRFQVGHPGCAGLRVSFSSGEYRIQKDNSRDKPIHQFKSRTTQFANGKKFTRTETTTIHANGKKEVLIEADNYVERRTSSVLHQMASHDGAAERDLPWYMSAWAGIKDKLTMCYSPCQVQ
jgi:DnaJ domain